MSKIKKRIIRLIISIVLFGIALIIDLTTTIAPYVVLLIYLPSYIVIGYDIIKKAFRSIFYGKILDENFLMTIATIGAFAIGEFTEAVAVMIFYHAGELFQTIAVRKSRKSVANLMDIRPEHTNVIRDGKIITTSPDNVSVGEIIEIRPGERIALDSIVISGSSNINTSALTGESMPQLVSKDDTLISGCINIDGILQAKVTTEYSNSTVSKILNLVQYAQEKKSKSENFITKFARIYTPIVCILALILAILPPLLVGNWPEWIYRALCFLVVSCPCALVISIPLSFFAGIGCASKHGILIKGSAYLEKLTKINSVVFDKTGTLTKGVFQILEITPKENTEKIMKLATIAESKSTHPIATAILNYNSTADSGGYSYKNILGEGIIATNKDNVIIAGNAKLLTDNNIEIPQNTTDDNTIIHIAHNGKYVGTIIIGDQIKEETKETITQLNNQNITTIMLSGDNENIAKQVADEVGIKRYYYDMLPDDKMHKLEEIINHSKATAYIGDGINDSPSLMRADVGISMGSLGSDSAIEASDIVIMNDNLKNILHAKNIANKTMNIVKQNIIFALGIKVIILILSALGLSNMWWAIFGDVGVSVIAILNAIRALRYNKKS